MRELQAVDYVLFVVGVPPVIPLIHLLPKVVRGSRRPLFKAPICRLLIIYMTLGDLHYLSESQ